MCSSVCVDQTLVQLGLYAMGRDHRIFPHPEQYCPSRWVRSQSHYFKSLSFGFGPRQCLGRRIAETEMQLFLIHVCGGTSHPLYWQSNVAWIFFILSFCHLYRCWRTSGLRSRGRWRSGARLSSSCCPRSPSCSPSNRWTPADSRAANRKLCQRQNWMKHWALMMEKIQLTWNAFQTFELNYVSRDLKGTVHTKMKILSSFTHPHSNLYEFFFFETQKIF